MPAVIEFPPTSRDPHGLRVEQEVLDLLAAWICETDPPVND